MPSPSFVFIMTDTQATNVLGCYGHPDLQTPHIDRLAADGVTFNRAYTTDPLCTPARAALFTGFFPHANGAWVNGLPIGQTFVHMGQRFRDHGYRTAYTGKWHLDGHDYFGTGICPDGWDDRYWYDGRRHLESLTPEERSLWRNGLTTPQALREHDVKAEWTWAHRVSDRAVDFLAEASRTPQQPFVLAVSYDEPHGPFTCPPEYAERFLDYRYPLGQAAFDTLEDKPQHQRDWSAARARERTGYAVNPMYFGCNSFVDAEIGRVIDAVDRLAPDETYIIFTSDHGEQLGAHGIYAKGAAVYESNINIPLIVRLPGRAGAGTRRETLASHIDVLPTMLDLAGLPVPPALEGQSLVPLLRGGPEDLQRPVFVEFHRYELPADNWGGFTPMRAIVKGPYKLAINLLDTDELYDRGSDPDELHNRIEDPAYAAVRDALHEELIDWQYRSYDPFRGPAWERRPWRSTRTLTWQGGWKGTRRSWDDGYAPSRLNYRTGLPGDPPPADRLT